MGNCNDGNYSTTDKLIMQAYDKLPPSARKALQDAVEDWVPQPLLTLFRRKGWTGPEIAERVKEWDKQELSKREKERKRGYK